MTDLEMKESATPRTNALRSKWGRQEDPTNFSVEEATEIYELADQLERELLHETVLHSKLLEFIRHNESIDNNGDPVYAQPETQWEIGYAAGVRCVYRFLRDAVEKQKEIKQ